MGRGQYNTIQLIVWTGDQGARGGGPGKTVLLASDSSSAVAGGYINYNS